MGLGRVGVLMKNFFSLLGSVGFIGLLGFLLFGIIGAGVGLVLGAVIVAATHGSRTQVPPPPESSTTEETRDKN